MKEAKHFFNGYKHKTLSGINTCLVGQIERYNPTANKADILLQDGSLITEIPMGAIQTAQFFIRVPYQSGDYVLVVFAQRDIDGIFHGGEATPTDRMLSLDDAIGAIGLNVFNDPLPAADANKMVIGQKDGAAKITIGGGVIDFIGTVKVNGTSL